MQNLTFLGSPAALAFVFVLATGDVAGASPGDCARPVSDGETPTAADCLAILKTAVGSSACDPQCICDTNGSGQVTVNDALLCLFVSVGSQGGPGLSCSCPDPQFGVTSAEVSSLAGSALNIGWNGIGHQDRFYEGASFTYRVLRRCDGGAGTVCAVDADCPNRDCEPTCDGAVDSLCEIVGPTHEGHCATTLTRCRTDADCPDRASCLPSFGPPLPLSSGGTPVCALSFFDGDFFGTVNTATGSSAIPMDLRWRVFMGIDSAQPCPRCGPPESEPRIGDQFTCEGGQTHGASCVVEALDPVFGGTSRDCAPELGGAVTGVGIAIRFRDLTTGESTKQAAQPCSSFLHRNHPSNGGATCLDNSAPCTSNDDCLRCADDLSPCASDEDCGGAVCAAAPEQPVSCGFYCHCGFCDDDPDLPCFSDDECGAAQECVAGTSNSGPNLPQEQPNECSAAAEYLCGRDATEECPGNISGRCSDQSFRICFSDDSCEFFDAGTCEFDEARCFESTITRTGQPAPLGSYCLADPANSAPCTSNSDCGPGDRCAGGVSRSTMVALFCSPATFGGTVNYASGITGPGALEMRSLVKFCSCGDGEIGCDESCDDGNRECGDGCDENCQIE